MSIALNLLEDVRCRGRPVAGDRPRALLAALAARECGIRGADAIVRDGSGYRLGASPGEVDSARLSKLVRDAAAALDRDAAAAALAPLEAACAARPQDRGAAGGLAAQRGRRPGPGDGA